MELDSFAKTTWVLQIQYTCAAENIQLNPEFNLDVTFTDPSMDVRHLHFHTR